MPIARDPQTLALDRMRSIAERLVVTFPENATISAPSPSPNGPAGVGLELSYPAGDEMVRVQAWFRVSDLVDARDEQIVEALRMMVVDSIQSQILQSKAIALSCGTARERVRTSFAKRRRHRRPRARRVRFSR